MPALIKCDRCKALISKSASICPQCNVPVPNNRGACRACGEALAISKHRYTNYAQSVVVIDGSGGTRTSRFIQHIACPKCAEPRPLEQLVDKPAAKAVGFLGIIIGLVGLVSLPLTLPMLDKPFDSAGKTGQIAIIVGLVVLALAVLALMSFGLVALNTTNKYLARGGALRFGRLLWIIGVGAGLIAGVVAFTSPQRAVPEAHSSSKSVALAVTKAQKHSSAHKTAGRPPSAASNSQDHTTISALPEPNAVTLRGVVLTATCRISSGMHVYAKPPSPDTTTQGASTWSTIIIPRIPGCEQQVGRELRLPVKSDEQ